MYIAEAIRGQWRLPIEGLTEAVQHPAEAVGGHRNVQRRIGVVHRDAALEPRGVMQRDGTHMACIEVLVDLEQECLAIVAGAERSMNGREGGTFDDHYRPVDLGDPAYGQLSWID